MEKQSQLFTELGNFITSKRITAGLSQEELALRCSLHLNAVWKIENAKSEIKLSTLINIFNELDIPFVELDELLVEYYKKLDENQ